MSSEMSTHGPTLRLLAVLLSAAVTVLYAVVGLELVKVDGVADVAPGPAVPLVVAAVAFALLTLALSMRPRPAVYVAGIVLTAAVIVGYFVVAPSRHPSFEAWGLSIKAVQAALLVTLVLLAVRRRIDVPDTVAGARAPEAALR